MSAAKKLLFAIFAHPDDEAFGPSASLYYAAQNHTDVHLILVTDGEKGNNPNNSEDLGSVRITEWQESANLIGARSTIALHFPDGGLNNDLYLDIAHKINKHISTVLEGYNQPLSIDFMTFENGGISGHIDHIAVSYISTYVFLKLKNTRNDVGVLKYFYLPECQAPNHNTDWIYMSKGHPEHYADEVIDYTEFKIQKFKIMKAHKSQYSDMNQIIERQKSINEACRYKDYFIFFKD